MGFTPLEGLLMGTRSGDLDPSLILYIMGKEGLTLGEANTLLNKHSGLIGISGESSDMREILSAVKDNQQRAKWAFEIFTYRIKNILELMQQLWVVLMQLYLLVESVRMPKR